MVAAYRFAADLKSKSDLRSQAEKNQAERRDSAPMARVVAFANQRGYSFTIDEAKERLSAWFFSAWLRKSLLDFRSAAKRYAATIYANPT